jgi:hypothetical protein
VHRFARQFSQGERVRRACGAPCAADHVLHMESFAHEWPALLARLRVMV